MRSKPITNNKTSAKTPTKIIERKNHLVEQQYYKEPRKPLVRASRPYKEISTQVDPFRIPTQKERIDLHTHVHSRTEKSKILPSSADLSVSRKDYGKNKTFIIASRRKGTVVGYTFFRVVSRGKITPAYKEVDKFINLQNNAKTKHDAKQFNTALKKINEAGFHVRFVPNLKEGYIFSKGRFIKASSNKKLLASKKQRVSFLQKTRLQTKKGLVKKTLEKKFVLNKLTKKK